MRIERDSPPIEMDEWSVKDIPKILDLHDKLLKGLFRGRFTGTLCRLGSRFFAGAIGKNDTGQYNSMTELLTASPALKERVATLMDPDAFASTMDRCQAWSSGEQGSDSWRQCENYRCQAGLTVELTFVNAVSAHVSGDDDLQLRKDLAGLLLDGLVDLFQPELPDECYIVGRHEDFLAILPA